MSGISSRCGFRSRADIWNLFEVRPLIPEGSKTLARGGTRAAGDNPGNAAPQSNPTLERSQRFPEKPPDLTGSNRSAGAQGACVTLSRVKTLADGVPETVAVTSTNAGGPAAISTGALKVTVVPPALAPDAFQFARLVDHS